MSKALRPEKVLNTFSLEMTPQMPQSPGPSGPRSTPGHFTIVSWGGEWWLGPGLHPGAEIPTHKVAAPPLPHPDSGATSTLLCYDRAESGAGTVSPLVPFPRVLRPVPEFTPLCWPQACTDTSSSTHPPAPTGVPPDLVPNDYVQIGDDGCRYCFCCL